MKNITTLIFLTTLFYFLSVFSIHSTDYTKKIWKPKPFTTFDWQLTGDINTETTAIAIDIDAFESTKELVAKLQKKGKKVIAYISVGTVEDWRLDKDNFPKEIIGKRYIGWQGERWIDIKQIDKLAPIILSRLDMIKDKGFDAVEPDNIDGFETNTGFDITREDTIKFCKWLINEAHKRGLSIGQKNVSSISNELVEYFDWILIEDAFADNWYNEVKVYINNNKAVFSTEYTDNKLNFDKICKIAKELKYTLILKKRDLTSWIKTCE